jgi:6-phosphogluconolactonase
MKSLFTSILIVLVLLAGGCGGGSFTPNPPPDITISSGRFLYVVNSIDGTVSGFAIAPTGELTAVAGAGQSALIQAPTGIATNIAGKVYVGSSTSRNVTTFSASTKTGQLSNPVAFPTTFLNSPSGTNAAHLATCGTRLFAFGEGFSTRPGSPTTSNGWSGAQYNLFSDGSIDPINSSGFGTSSAAPIVSNGFIDQSCRYIFHANTGSDTVSQVTIDSTINSAHFYLDYPAGSAPLWVSGELNAKFIYVANSGSNDVSAFSTDLSTGILTPIAGSKLPTGSQPSSVIVVQGWVYVANAGDNTVSAFTWNQITGALTAVPGSPFPVGNHPVAFATTITDLSHSPSGMLLYVANRNSNNVSAFTIDTNGALHPVAGSPFPVGSGPADMAVLLGPV